MNEKNNFANIMLFGIFTMIMGIMFMVATHFNRISRGQMSPDMYYSPGETLNPNCSPQDPRCGVRQ